MNRDKMGAEMKYPKRERKDRKHALDKIIPVYNILWDIFHGVLEKKPVFVPEHWSLAVFKGYFVYRIAERQLFGIRSNAIQILSA
jgi:hypothetical protein